MSQSSSNETVTSSANVTAEKPGGEMESEKSPNTLENGENETKVQTFQKQLKTEKLEANVDITQNGNAFLLNQETESPVKHLFFSLRNTEADAIRFKMTVLENIRTLQKIELFRLFRNGEIKWNVTQDFASLKKLYLYNFCFPSLDVLNFLPNLETLFIDTNMYNCLNRLVVAVNKPTIAKALGLPKYKVQKNIITGINSDVLPLLSAMKHFHIDQDLHVDSWKIVSEWMPNLERLETILGPKGFQNVCRHLPNLNCLVLLHGSKMDDETLTGVTKVGRNPDNITSFTQLETFQILRFCGKPNFRTPPNCRLGDLSVYRGFFEMSYLENVSIHASRNMTCEAETLLRKHVQSHVQVIRSYMKSKTYHTSECCDVREFLNRCPPQYKDSLIK